MSHFTDHVRALGHELGPGLDEELLKAHSEAIKFDPQLERSGNGMLAVAMFWAAREILKLRSQQRVPARGETRPPDDETGAPPLDVQFPARPDGHGGWYYACEKREDCTPLPEGSRWIRYVPEGMAKSGDARGWPANAPELAAHMVDANTLERALKAETELATIKACLFQMQEAAKEVGAQRDVLRDALLRLEWDAPSTKDFDDGCCPDCGGRDWGTGEKVHGYQAEEDEPVESCPLDEALTLARLPTQAHRNARRAELRAIEAAAAVPPT